MQRDTFVLWAKYNKTVNIKMNEVIKTLKPEEWEKPLGGYFKSVQGICSHIYVCDFNWLKLFSKLREFKILKERFFVSQRLSVSDVLFEDMKEYLDKRPILDEIITHFVDELVYGDLNKYLEYADSKGAATKRLFGGLLTQFFSHSVHHRGMISLYLELLGHKNNFSSFGAVLENTP